MPIIIRALGHASFKLNIDGKIIYIDPYGGDDSEYSEKADLILCSHEHRDHSDPDKIKLMQTDKTKIITSSKNASKLTGDVTALDPGGEIELYNFKIHGVPGYNVKRFRSEGVPFHPKEIQTAFIIEAEGKKIYFAADTDFIEEMKDLKDIDVAMLPIGDTYTMDFNDALEAVETIKPKMVIPMHWREHDPEDFKKMVEDKVADVSVKILQAGNEMTL